MESKTQGVVNQPELQRLFKRGNLMRFLKNTPVALIPFKLLDQYVTPEQAEIIRSELGRVDNTSYDDEYLRNGYLVFQWDGKNSRPDLYVADPEKYRSMYARYKGQLPKDHKSRSKIPSLVMLDKLGIDESKIPFFIKKIPTEMILASDVDLEGRTIQASWGTQDVADGGYIVREDNGHCYTVAPDADGLPIGYIPAE